MRILRREAAAPLAVLCVVVSALSACNSETALQGGVLASGLSSEVPRLEDEDKSLADRNLQDALENSLSGQSRKWTNPSSGNGGSVTPLSTWKTAKGVYCRSYRERIRVASGQSVSRRGVACRSSDAVWQSA